MIENPKLRIRDFLDPSVGCMVLVVIVFGLLLLTVIVGRVDFGGMG